MIFSLNDFSGSLFQNKKTNEKQPDYTGKIKLENLTYQIVAWKKKDKNGNEYISIRVDDPASIGEGFPPVE